MLSNLHTHTTFCDGKDTPEEIILYAIDRGFSSIGFSGHGYTPFDLRYCMKDTDGYIKEISALVEKYRNKIQIYCGVEEDAFSAVQRDRFDYIIGSLHYGCVDGKYYPIDSSRDYFARCLEAYGNDAIALAKDYYANFTRYIAQRKPDIVGHFDLITKFDETEAPLLLSNPEYIGLSEKYMEIASDCDVLFEVNTGAISRGYRSTPYPAENLLHILRKKGGKVILSSDSHSAKTLDFYFDKATELLKDIGFDGVYELCDGEFVKRHI